MARIWLHLGMMKTGTSAMQEWFAEHRDALHAKGLQYITGGGNRTACGNIAEALAQGGAIADAKLGIIRDLLKSTLQEDVLISAEAFSQIGPEALRPLVTLLQGHELHFLIWLRRQDRFAEALYKQHVKWGGPIGDFQRFLSPAMLRLLDYPRMLEAWQTTFPDVTLHPYLYPEEDEGRPPDSIAAMCRALGREDLIPEDSTKIRANISPHAEMVALYNQIPKDQARALRRSNRQIMKEFGPRAAGRDDLFPEDLSRSLMQHFEASNLALKEKWFPERERLFAPLQPRDTSSATVDPEVIARFRQIFAKHK